MRTLNEVIVSSPEVPPFSNGTEGEIWMAQWCHRCHNPVEKAWQDYEAGKRKTQLKGYEGGCPLVMAAYVGHTPAEWMEQPDRIHDYHCIEFRGGDDGSGEPHPKPDPPNMDGLFDRPERRVRMLQQEFSGCRGVRVIRAWWYSTGHPAAWFVAALFVAIVAIWAGAR